MSCRRLAFFGLAVIALGGSLLPVARAQDASAPSASVESAAPDPVGVVGPPRGPALSAEALEKRTSEVASKLRCPVCQGLSVEASPTGSARNMRVQVRDMLSRGFDEEQVLRYFEASYGEFVRLEPPLRGLNWVVWLSPAVGLLVGGLFVRLAWRRLSRASTAEIAPADSADSARGATTAAIEALDRDALPADPELARAVLVVRERAFGWPGGRSAGSRGGSEGKESR